MNVLGVMLDSHLNFGEHIDYVISSGAQSMYALKMLKSHGMSKVEHSMQSNSYLKVNICLSFMVGIRV